MPTAIELVYDNYNALAIGYSSTERASGAIVSLAVYASGVNLYFMHGATLPDPDHILKGSGNQGRFVRLKSAAEFNSREIQAFLRAAIKQAKSPLPATGRGYTLIRLVLAKQRPRRSSNKRLAVS